jgi:hypothetical protein
VDNENNNNNFNNNYNFNNNNNDNNYNNNNGNNSINNENGSKIKNIILLILIIIIILIIFGFCITYNTLKKLEFENKNNNQMHCKPGYYIPSDNLGNKQCIKCSIEHCKKCYGNSNSNICTSCFSSFILKYDNSNKISFCQKEDNKEEEIKIIKPQIQLMMTVHFLLK